MEANIKNVSEKIEVLSKQLDRLHHDAVLDEIKRLIEFKDSYCVGDLLRSEYGQPFLDSMFPSDQIYFRWDEDERTHHVWLIPTRTLGSSTFSAATNIQLGMLLNYARTVRFSIGRFSYVWIRPVGEMWIRGDQLMSTERMLEDLHEVSVDFPYTNVFC
jgi:hypothetical protein